MNYDSIILELMSRIKDLEERVDILEGKKSVDGEQQESILQNNANSRITTSDIRRYIEELITIAGNSGDDSITLVANQIHKDLNLKSRFPMVCNAMRQCMRQGDEIIFESPSGYSSSLKIKYNCKQRL